MLRKRGLPLPSFFPQRCLRPAFRHRFHASKASQTIKPEEPAVKVQSRLDKTINRLPKFLQRYLTPVRHAPLSHITSFLILHEITAIIPLFGLWASFHYTNWLPPYFAEGKWVHEGIERFGRYFRRKRWFGFGRDQLGSLEEEEAQAVTREIGKRELWWNRGQGGVKILVEVATAWAVTKALLPLRIIVSVWGTPWFARVMLQPISSRLGRLFRRKT
ncbi:hypothetical protein EV356DRAFT_504786 [Viridothelium virens]|uniref:Uncharacterized protein n=1 Tax=Viridothelium virens TaxID=1048519 RepID=A0A6A6H3X0_VIRVR|nr:hypothetical protein EV356DRAFT_504786 [Viridothelium virens]